MSVGKVEKTLEQWGRALDRLEEALAVRPANEHIQDSVNMRFLLVYELSWKSMKALLNYVGEEDTPGPRVVFKQAYRRGWLETEAPWLNILEDRNLMSHRYQSEWAKEVFGRVRKYAPEMRSAWKKLNEVWREAQNL